MSFFKTVHLYNHINTQFQALKEFHEIEDQFRQELHEEIQNILNNVKGQKKDDLISSQITTTTQRK